MIMVAYFIVLVEVVRCFIGKSAYTSNYLNTFDRFEEIGMGSGLFDHFVLIIRLVNEDICKIEIIVLELQPIEKRFCVLLIILISSRI